MSDDFVKSTHTMAIDHINAGRAQLNQLERLVNEHMPNENTTLYKWDMIPAGYDYAACNPTYIIACDSPLFYRDSVCTWKTKYDQEQMAKVKMLPLTVLNRLPGEPSTTLEKRPGVE